MLCFGTVDLLRVYDLQPVTKWCLVFPFLLSSQDELEQVMLSMSSKPTVRNTVRITVRTTVSTTNPETMS